MYNKECQLVDRRELLRIKLKSLAAEARIIRQEERRTWGLLRQEMEFHRRQFLRKIARETHIAYALIRGVPLDKVEAGRTNLDGLDAKAINAMVAKYGSLKASLAQ